MRTIAVIVCVIATLFAQRAAAQQACPSIVVSTNDGYTLLMVALPEAPRTSPGNRGFFFGRPNARPAAAPYNYWKSVDARGQGLA
jgi:hypothetical protein